MLAERRNFVARFHTRIDSPGSVPYVCVMDDDPVIRNALLRREAAEAEVRRWDEFICTYKELLNVNSAAAPSPQVVQVGMRNRSISSAIADLRVLGPVSSPTETERFAAEVIRETGRPVPTREMFNTAQSRGHNVGGSDAYATLSARLHRAQSLVLEKGIGWRLRDEPGQKNEAAGPRPMEFPAASEPTTSTAVEPVGGGGI